MKKRIISITLILLLGGIFFEFAQMLVMPKYMTESREGALISEYYRDQSSHDVLFLGDCETYECFTPPTLFEEYGITSYIRGTPQQLIWQSYYLLEDTLRKEKPKAVVFNVYSMCYGTPQNEAYNRIALDGMQFSPVKIRAVLASMTEEESFLSYIFPIFRFHSRWKEIGKEDFQYLFRRDTVSHNGYLMQTGIQPKETDVEENPLEDSNLPDICWEYLDRIRILCQLNDIQLILIKAPTNFWKYHWYEAWDRQIRKYAEQCEIPYYNFIPEAEQIGLDWATDTYDGGAHLNVFGAEKLTSYFGKILKEEFHLPDHRDDAGLSALWTEKYQAYQSEKEKGKTE